MDEGEARFYPFASSLIITPTVEPLLPLGLEEHHLGLPTLVSELRGPNRRSVGVRLAGTVAVATWAVLGVAVFAAVYCNQVVPNQ